MPRRRRSTRSDVDTSASTSSLQKSLEVRVAYLRWRKMQNNQSIREVLRATRDHTERDALVSLSMTQTHERERWQQTVIQDEFTRPLRMGDTVRRDLEERRQREHEAAEAEALRHADSLKRLREQVRARDGEKLRGRRHREATKALDRGEDPDAIQVPEVPSGADETLGKLLDRVKEQKRVAAAQKRRAQKLREDRAATRAGY